MICFECKTKKSNHWYKKNKNWYCEKHAGSGNIRRIMDAQGNLRDRDWLNQKVEMTRTEKNWHNDIKSRRIMPDGSVRRVKQT